MRQQMIQQMKKHRDRYGFTLAELLVVIAIIGILVAVSIPIFAGQRRKAVVATNKANIRAARAAGIAQYYDDLSAGKFQKQQDKYPSRAYYYYDTASGKITGEQYCSDNSNWDYVINKTEYGKKAYDTACGYGICNYIIIYASPTSTETGSAIQTAPYYMDAGGDKPLTTNSGKDFFGPAPGGKY